MDVSRRDVVVAGAFALGASSLLISGSAGAEAGDEAAVTWKLLARQGFRLPA